MAHFVMHEGKGINPHRQQSPHPHCSLFSRDGTILFVSDLGTDQICYYQSSGKNIELMKNKSIKMVGCGPRHLAHGK